MAEEETEVTTEEVLVLMAEEEAEVTTEEVLVLMAEEEAEVTTEEVFTYVVEAEPESATEAVLEPITEERPEWITETESEIATEEAPGLTTEGVFEAIREEGKELTSKAVTERTTESSSEAVTERTTESASEAVTERITESMAETLVGEEDKSAMELSDMEFRGSDYTVKISCTRDAGIPEDAFVEAEEIAPDSGEYARCLSQARSALGMDENLPLPETYARFFDIRILAEDEEGQKKEIEPAVPVQVAIRYDEPVVFIGSGSAEANIVHFDEKEDEVRVLAKEDVFTAPFEIEDPDLFVAGESMSLAKTGALEEGLEDVFVAGSEGEEEAGESYAVVFRTDSFSVYGVIYTVDFEYMDYAWSIPGGSAALLSKVLGILETGIDINDVEMVRFSDPSLVEVSPAEEYEGGYDWILLSLQPFDTEEQLTLTLNDGRTVVIEVTDDQTVSIDDTTLAQLLTRVDIYSFSTEDEEAEYIGGSQQTAVVRRGQQFDLRLVFAEDEDGLQFPDSGIMKFELPDTIDFSGNISTKPVDFTISLGRKYELKGNKATFHPAEGGTPAYITIEWNETGDPDNYKRLVASPRATITLHYTVTIDVETGEHKFTDDICVSVQEDPHYSLELEKTGEYEPENDRVKYTVTVKAIGNATDIDISDRIGKTGTASENQALKYISSNPEKESTGVSVTYSRQVDGQTVDAAGIEGDYGEENIKLEEKPEGANGFDLHIYSLKDGDTATLTYYADIDYQALRNCGSNEQEIKDLTKNAVTADGKDTEAKQSFFEMEDTLSYLSIFKFQSPDKSREDFIQEEDSGYYTVPWTIVYNPERRVDVEGTTLTDKVYVGAVNATTYDIDKPFFVKVYESGDIVETEYVVKDEEGNVIGHGTKPTGFTPGSLVAEYTQNWVAAGSTDEGVIYQDFILNGTHDEDGKTIDQHSNWSWTIPDKNKPMIGTETPVYLDPEKHYTYVITYYTKTEIDQIINGYIGNVVTDTSNNNTYEGEIEFPGTTTRPELTVDKEWVENQVIQNNTITDVYSKWTITFDRRSYALDRCVVEDTLPHGQNSENTSTKYVDSYQGEVVNPSEANGEQVGGYSVDGLREGERCVPEYIPDSGRVIFRFYTNYQGVNDSQNKEGLLGYADDTDKSVTITFWTKNNPNWMTASQMNEAPIEHTNVARLVQNAQEATDADVEVPKRPGILKTADPQPAGVDQSTLPLNMRVNPEPVGYWQYKASESEEGNGVPVPVFRYTLTLTGIDALTFDSNDQIVITDVFDNKLRYLKKSDLENLLANGKYSGKAIPSNDEKLVQTAPIPETEIVRAVDPIAYTSLENGNGNNQLTFTINKGSDTWDGVKYEISYYLTVDETKIIDLAKNVTLSNSSVTTDSPYSNTARWSVEGLEVTGTQPVTVDYKPVSKDISYNSATETAFCTIEVNPYKLKINDGKFYKLTDKYANIAVDFATVKIETEPKCDRNIEWTFHNNEGTFWLPDETYVKITYEAWPVGQRGKTYDIWNEAQILDRYTKRDTEKITLSVDHEGSAASYSVRVYKFEDDNMEKPLKNAVFQLFTESASHIVPVKYQTTIEDNSATNNDPAWADLYKEDWTGAPVTTHYPTPDNHKVGDNVYFITGKDGIAEIMLSQHRDGVALKKGVRYYLREVVTPPGHVSENIDWMFTIADNDDFPNYVYSDGSLLQIANASAKPSVLIRKTIDDRTHSLTDDQINGITFVIRGTQSNNPDSPAVYYKEASFGSFMPVDVPDDSIEGTHREYWMSVPSGHLPEGYYTVTEERESAQFPDTVLTPSIDLSRTTDAGKANANLNFVEGDPFAFHFQVTAENKDSIAIQADYTNIYVDEPVQLTIKKKWGDEEPGNGTVRFAIYRDGVKYGDISLPITNGGTKSWETTVTGLPRHVTEGEQAGREIEWTVAEIGATYQKTEKNGNDGDPAVTEVTVETQYMTEHFSTTAKVEEKAAQTTPAEEEIPIITGGQAVAVPDDGTITFTNILKSTVAVKVEKKWKNAADEEETSHDMNDVVYFDLYRTTNPLPESLTRENLEVLTDLQIVLENVPLTYEEGKGWQFDALMEKFSGESSFHYIALERSVAGYQDGYKINTDSDGNQTITITNQPSGGQGSLEITKTVTGYTGTDKQFKFTLWNSGKYLDSNGTLRTPTAENPAHLFSISTDQTLNIPNVKPGVYTLTEILDGAEVDHHSLNVSIATPVTNASGTQTSETTTGNTAVLVVTDSIQTQATIHNDYVSEKTSFKFGKLWIGPNERDTTTLIWPDDTSINVKIQRRKKAETRKAGDVDATWSETYTITKTGTQTVTVNGVEETRDILTIKDKNGNVTDALRWLANDYNHYTFELENLDKYAGDNATEWVYYATEESYTAPGGVAYEQMYGRVTGIVALVTNWEDAAGANEVQTGAEGEAQLDNITECAINRLKLAPAITIPVKKIVSGLSRIIDYTQFEFQLYKDNKPVYLDSNDEPVMDNAAAKQDVSGNPVNWVIKAGADGTLVFNVEKLLDLNNTLKWQEVDSSGEFLGEFRGVYHFSIAEKEPENKITGMSYFKGKLPVAFEVTYKWTTGELRVNMRIDGHLADTWTNDQSQTDVAHAQTAAVAIENKYNPETVTVQADKTWVDNNDQDGRRRTVQFKVHAFITIPEGESLTVDGKTYNGKIISSEEDATPGEGTPSEENTATDEGTYELEKVWRVWLGDNGNWVRFGETQMPCTIEAKGTNASDTWSTNPKLLPKYFEGYEITYTVEEDLEGSGLSNYYEKIRDETDKSQPGKVIYSATNRHIPEATDISVTKTWVDSNDPRNTKPSEATVVLKADGEIFRIENDSENQPSGQQTLNAGNSQTYTWQGLPVFKDGEKIVYTVEEENVPMGYHCVVSDPTHTDKAGTTGIHYNSDTDYVDSFSMINTYEPVDITVTKNWEDDSDRDGIRRDNNINSVNVKLTADGIDNLSEILATEQFLLAADQVVSDQASSTSQTMTVSNSWTRTWRNLPKYYNNKEILYKVVEDIAAQEYATGGSINNDTVDTNDLGYTVSYSTNTAIGENGYNYTVTNSRPLDETSVSLTKIWDDHYNQDGKRPDVADYVKKFVKFEAVLESGSDSKTQLYIEQNACGVGTYHLFTSADTQDATTEFFHNGQPATVTLVGTNTAGNSNEYTITFSNLPKNKQGGKADPVVYTVEETDDAGNTLSVNGAHLAVNADNSSAAYKDYAIETVMTQAPAGSWSVKNKYTPETVTVTATKVWDTPGDNTNSSDAGKAALRSQVKFKLHVYDGNEDITGRLTADTTNGTGGSDSLKTVWDGYSYTLPSEKTLGSDDTVTWVNLPKYLPGQVGRLLTYKVEETATPDGYRIDMDGMSADMQKPVGDDYQVTIKNIYEETEIIATKQWDDDGNRDNARPAVTLKLQRKIGSGTFMDMTSEQLWAAAELTIAGTAALDAVSATISSNPASDTQNVVWSHLPAWIGNEKVTYNVVEVTPVEGYTVTQDGDPNEVEVEPEPAADSALRYRACETIINTRTVTTVQGFSFIKHWDDANNQDGKRPDPESFILKNVRVFMEKANIDGNEYSNVVLVPFKDDTSGEIYLVYHYTESGTEKTKQVTVQTVEGQIPATVSWVGSNASGFSINNNNTPENASDDTTTITVDGHTFDYNIYAVHFHNMPVNYLNGQNIIYTMKEVQDTAELTPSTDQWLFSKCEDDDVTAEQTHRYTFGDAEVSNNNEYDISKVKYTENSEEKEKPYEFEATNKHTPDLINISIKKEWDTPDNSALSQPQEVKVMLYADGIPVDDTIVTLSSSSDWSHTWKENPAYHKYEAGKVGDLIEYTVREEGVPLGYIEKPSTVTTADPNQILAFEIENQYKTGSLKIEKTVDSDVAGDLTHEFHFRVKLVGINDNTFSGRNFNSDNITIRRKLKGTEEDGTELDTKFDSNGEVTFTLTHNQYVEIKNLPIDMTYEVEEYGLDDAENAFLTNFNRPEKQTGTVTQTPAELSFINERKTGELELTKTVSNTNKIPGDNDILFDFTVTLTAPSDSSQNLTDPALVYSNNRIQYQIGNEEPQFLTSNSATISLKHGQTVKITGLPVGTSYTIVESANNSFERIFTPANGETNDVNGEAVGTIGIVSDTIDGMNNDNSTSDETENPSGNETEDANGGGSNYGSDTEPNNEGGGGTDGANEGGTSSTNDDVSVSAGGGETDLVIATNTRKTGSLKLNKIVVSPVLKEREDNYTFTVVLAKDGNPITDADYQAKITDATRQDQTIDLSTLGTTGSVSVPVTVKGNQSATITNLPVDVTYTIEEKDTPENFTSNPDNATNQIAVDSKDESQHMVPGRIATFTNTRKTGTLTVEKTVNSNVNADKTREFHFKVEVASVGEHGALVDNLKYTINTPGEDGNTTSEEGSFTNNVAEFTLKNGQTMLVSGIPTDLHYKVTEYAIDSTEDDYLKKFNTSWGKTGDAEEIQLANTGTQSDGNEASGEETGADSQSTVHAQKTLQLTGQSAALSCTNTRKTGDLKLSKKVNSPLESEKNAYYYYKVELETREGVETPETSIPVSGTYTAEIHTVSGEGDTNSGQLTHLVVFNETGEAIIPVQAGENCYVVLKGLPVDVQYLVSEVDTGTPSISGYTPTNGYQASVFEKSGEITDTNPQSVIETSENSGCIPGVQITNTRQKIPVTFLKVSSLDAETPLDGAEFTLMPVVEKGQTSPVNWASKQLKSDKGYLKEVVNGTVSGDGILSLPKGTYQITEIKAPVGYVLSVPSTFVVDPLNPNGVVYADGILGNDNTVIPGSESVILKAANSPGVKLPATGGPGRGLSNLLGGILTLAGFLLILRKRRET